MGSETKIFIVSSRCILISSQTIYAALNFSIHRCSRGLGFEIVCEIEEGFIIVATEDVDLSIFNQKADAFIANVTSS